MSAAWRSHLRSRLRSLALLVRERAGWHLIAVLIVLLCAMVIVLELIPSRSFFRTTFIATIETQEARLRLDDRQAALMGVSGRRILARELSPVGDDTETDIFDLADSGASSLSSASGDLELVAKDAAAYLELDRLWLPPKSAVKFSSGGEGASLAVEFIEPGDAQQIDARLVWRGSVGSSDEDRPEGAVGTRTWRANKPSISVDEARIRGLAPLPIDLSAIALDRVLSVDEYQSPVSAILGGDLQFDIGGYPGKPLPIREGEFLSFDNLEAQAINLALSEKGLRFLLIGEADAISLGFAASRRDVQPSMLDAILARQSLTILASALFAMFLALMGAINFGGRK